jgi:potassium-dependent mechanosensitive channel
MLNTKIKEVLTIFTLMWDHKLFTIAGIKISLGNLTVAMILLLFATRLSRLATRIINRRIIEPFVEDKSSQNTYQTFAFYGSLALFVTLSLTIAGIPLTVFTVVGGALAIGVGFGSQNIVNNFISGVIILVEQPVKVGDTVEVDGMLGTVQTIGTRSTKIKNGDSKIYVIPNSFFLEKSVLNWNYETNIIRTTINFGVAYGSDVRLVESVCHEILMHTEGIHHGHAPKVIFEDFGDSNLTFQLLFWCDTTVISTLAEMRSAIRFKIDDKFKEHKISMAFPQRDMNIKIDKSLDVRLLP